MKVDNQVGPTIYVKVLNYIISSPGQIIFTSSCLQEGSCLIYFIYVCLCIVVSNTYCVVFLFCLSSFCVLCVEVSNIYCVVFICFVCLPLVSCVPNVASFSGLFILDCPFGFLQRLFTWLACFQRLLSYLMFQSFDYECTCCRLFQNSVVCTKLDIYVFIITMQV